MNQKPNKIEGLSKYAIHRNGTVTSLGMRKLVMRPSIDKNGYLRYRLVCDDGSKRSIYAHQLVAQSYIPNPKSKPFVNHKDFDKSNNEVSNLEWVTHTENIQHDWKHNQRKACRGMENGNHKYSDKIVAQLRKMYKTGCYTQTALAEMFEMPFSSVHVIVKYKERLL